MNKHEFKSIHFIGTTNTFVHIQRSPQLLNKSFRSGKVYKLRQYRKKCCKNAFFSFPLVEKPRPAAVEALSAKACKGRRRKAFAAPPLLYSLSLRRLKDESTRKRCRVPSVEQNSFCFSQLWLWLSQASKPRFAPMLFKRAPQQLPKKTTEKGHQKSI